MAISAISAPASVNAAPVSNAAVPALKTISFSTNAAHGNSSVKILQNGEVKASTIQVDLSNEEITDILNASDDIDITVGTYSAEQYVDANGRPITVTVNSKDEITGVNSTAKGISPVTATSLEDYATGTVVDVAGDGTVVDTTTYTTSKEVVENGEFNDVVVPYDGNNWLRLVVFGNGNWGVRFNWAWINANDTNRARFIGWMAKIQQGDQLNVSFRIRVNRLGVWVPAILTVGLRNPDTVVYDEYWNGFVKLKTIFTHLSVYTMRLLAERMFLLMISWEYLVVCM